MMDPMVIKVELLELQLKLEDLLQGSLELRDPSLSITKEERPMCDLSYCLGHRDAAKAALELVRGVTDRLTH